jgi:hypothetical protein
MYETLIHLTLAAQRIASSLESTVNPQGRPLGLIVVGIIELPVVVLFLAAFIGKPRSTKITSLFIGWVFVMFSFFVGAVFFLSFVLGTFYH